MGLQIYKIFRYDDLNEKTQVKFKYFKAKNFENLKEEVDKYYEKEKSQNSKFFTNSFKYELEELSDKDLENLAKYFILYDSSTSTFFKFFTNSKIIKYNFLTKFFLKKNERFLAKEKPNTKILILKNKNSIIDFKKENSGLFINRKVVN